MKRGGRIGLLYVLPGLAGLCVFYIAPFFYSLRYIFTRGVSQVEFVGLANFRDLFRNPAFGLAMKNTVIFTGISVPLLVLAALLLAAALQRRDSKFLRWTMLAPMIIPVASALLGWSAILGQDGLLGRLIQVLGGQGANYLAEPWARWSLMLMFFVKNLGYMTVILGGALASIPKEYREAYSLDSNSLWGYTFRIAAPIISPVIFFVAVLSLVNSFQIFREVYGLYGDYPPNSLYMLQTFMNNNFAKLNYSRLCTASFTVSMAIALAVSVYLWFQRQAAKEESGL
ncbi:carbohydrate ABC transporter permease [Intestinimonas sp. MSJ-38]|uniref:carbohydrate ABC transporter permease n=1 Tax=Intestinimonas sp. MSJ-38 TaxID=2841532 RepID=UPI001C1095FF|nr:sugar ABC transporter permease [Intestinimonas sp. MSJ-38]MBU5432448.1 sugar ABC transporter permease [Intestinimonas sp. MSJ-38]